MVDRNTEYHKESIESDTASLLVTGLDLTILCKSFLSQAAATAHT